MLPSAQGFTWPNPPVNNDIDRLVFERLQRLRIAPSELCDDETFLRRVTLDLVARPPTVAEYEAFMADPASDKRSRKIDALLADPAFADYQAALWAETLRVKGGNVSSQATVMRAAQVFADWIRAQFRANRPLDEFVSEMVTASGSNLVDGPTNLYTMLVHNRSIEPKMLAADFSQVFLGVQIQCAECHNHPFDRWTMDDYYGFVSFFTGVNRKPGIEPREKRIRWDTKAAAAINPIDGKERRAKALGAVDPVDTEGDPRPALAAWLTSPENEIFAKNIANRIWAHFLGRGICDPVDDLRVTNPPTNAPLLDMLAARLVEVKFNVRDFVRDICNSRVYQLSAEPTPSNAGDNRHFSHAHLRRLRADVLLDALVAVTGVPYSFPNWPPGTKAIEFFPQTASGTAKPDPGDPFLATFGRSGRGSVSCNETKTAPSLSQVMHVLVGGTLRDRLSKTTVIQDLATKGSTTEDVISGLFIRTLSRRPTSIEMSGLLELATTATDKHAFYEDILWGLLSSTEFSFNH